MNRDDMDPRRRKYWELFDFAASGKGLEIGPLHRTMVLRDEADVRYVDVTDRERLLEHYAGDVVVMAGEIPEIDYWLIQDDGRTLSLAEAVREGAPFGWVMASHVIEHVPDIIGWLAEVAEVVEDGGALVLAVPDRRYCFDVHRPPTTVGQMVAAHEAGDTRPSVRAVYDYFASVVGTDTRALWRGEYPDLGARIHSLTEAQHHVQRTLAGEYVDCHVWLFSPGSFVSQMHELRITGSSAWVVEQIIETPRNDLEFKVVMRRLPRGVDYAGSDIATTYGEMQPAGDQPDWVSESLDHPGVRRLERRLSRLQDRLAVRGERIERLRTRLAEQDARASNLRQPAMPARARALLRRARIRIRSGRV